MRYLVGDFVPGGFFLLLLDEVTIDGLGNSERISEGRNNDFQYISVVFEYSVDQNQLRRSYRHVLASSDRGVDLR